MRCFRDPTRGECFAVLGYQDLADNRASLTLLPGRTGGISDPTTCCLPARERSVNSVRNSLESSIEPDTREKRNAVERLWRLPRRIVGNPFLTGLGNVARHATEAGSLVSWEVHAY